MTIGLICALAVGAAFAEPSAWSDVERIVAVGDVHGDYNQFVKVLQDAMVIDEDGNWFGGKTHLIQLGDVPDRGPDTRKVMDLLMNLEEQAPKAGGTVHALIGNHEIMNMCGDLRYVTAGEYEAFGGQEEFRKQMSPEGTYGKWIAGHHSIVKINNVLFVHGGISPNYADTPIEEINRKVSESLSKRQAGIGRDRAGPQWYRGLARDSEVSLKDHLDNMLAKKQAGHIVIGHTVSPTGVQPRCGGRVIMVDVGMSAAYGGPAACLVIEKILLVD